MSDLQDALEELATWWTSESEEFRRLVASILAALPGGEELEELGIEPAPVGWKEAELLGRLLVALQDAADVRRVVRRLLEEEGIEAETDEA